MRKICTSCKTEKDLIDFYKSKATKDGYMYVCKECQKKKVNKRDSTEERRLHSREVYLENREYVESLKSSCEKCGESRPWVIQFHHVNPGDKRFTVAMFGTHSKETIADEVSKCICLCSNCHDEFHFFFGKKPSNPKEALKKFLDEEY